MLKGKTFVLVVVLLCAIPVLVMSNAALAKKKCLFVSEEIGPMATDVELYAWLQSKYDVTVEDVDNIKVNAPDTTTIKKAGYDFILISESIGSSDANPLKGFSMPILLLEAYMTRMDATGWCNTTTSNINYGATTGPGDSLVTIVNGNHTIAAGFTKGTDVAILSKIDGTNSLTWSKPMIKCDTIAVLKSDPTRVIVMAVEKGTTVYDNAGNKTFIQKARIALVGVYANNNKNISSKGYKIIEAGINWITAGTTAVDEEDASVPKGFTLSQNYPNPFNPVTTIAFTLPASSHTTLKVYDMLGKEVETLVDGDRAPGLHRAAFDASRLNSGVYFYKIQAGRYTDMKKMVLMK